jgi:hypothetical protein
MNRPIRFLVAIPLLLLVSCSDRPTSGGRGMDDTMLRQDIQLVAGARVFFGHQSVGANIVEGLGELSRDLKTDSLKLVKVDGPTRIKGACFLHAFIGTNGKPDTKCDAFAQGIKIFSADSIDVAFMKFCFADFGEQTDVAEVFRHYTTTMDSLKLLFPGVTFVHITAPLIRRTPWWKRTAKAVLGRGDDTDIKNRQLNEFNALVRERYRNEPMFDLAGIESTYPDGTRCIVEQDGTKLFTVVSEYTSDGGHLNEVGRRVVASEFIHALAKIIREKNK